MDIFTVSLYYHNKLLEFIFHFFQLIVGKEILLSIINTTESLASLLSQTYHSSSLSFCCYCYNFPFSSLLSSNKGVQYIFSCTKTQFKTLLARVIFNTGPIYLRLLVPRKKMIFKI